MPPKIDVTVRLVVLRENVVMKKEKEKNRRKINKTTLENRIDCVK